MFIKKLLSLVALSLVTASAGAANIDPGVRTGTLENGLTYYIQYNDNPAGTADFFLAQKVGSVNEAENQRGLAHFLEHMCFNGTTHFPGNSLITYLESIGVKFGAHLNAYTSTDETVYNICKVPTARQTAIDSCLLILHDWCSEISLNPADIDAERGVIVNEWRQRNSASNRMLEKASPRLYGGSVYGERLPIGLMSVVQNFKPQTIRDYYNKWYIPMNQAVIVVGDFDVAAVERKVKELFSEMPASRIKSSSVAELPEVPVSDNLTCVVECDPEQGTRQMQLYFRLPEVPLEPAAEARRKALSSFAADMLADRFEGLEATTECPHTNLGIGEVKYLMARGVPALTLRGMVKQGRESDALAAWYGELVRAVQHGFSNEELAKARKSFLGSVDERARHSSKPNNSYLARLAVRHFLDGGNKITDDDYNTIFREAAAEITADDVVNYIATAIGNAPAGASVLLYRPADEKSNADVEKALAKRFNEVSATKFDPYVPLARAEKLMTELPAAGKIITTDSIAALGAKEYKLSNGIRVVTKKTPYKADQIYVRGYSPGGLSLVYSVDKVPTLRCVNELMAEMKHGGHTAAEIRHILSSKGVKVSVSVGNNEEGLEAATNRRDMEDAFQMLYLRATAFEPDTTAFRNYVEAERNKVSGRRVNPTQAMGDSIHFTIYNRHPLAAHQVIEDVDKINLDTAIDTYRDRFGDMGDFTFMVVGDFNTDSLEMCISRYIASLPGNGRKEDARPFGYTFTPYDYDIHFTRGMENPQAIVYNFVSGPAEYNLDDLLSATVFGQLLRNRLLADLREGRGWTYSTRAHCAINPSISAGEGPMVMMPTYIKVEPGHELETRDIVRQTIDSLCDASNITADEIRSIREFLVKNHAEVATDNAYWLKVIKSYERDGLDIESEYDAAVGRITPESVADFGRRVVKPANKASIIMSAEKN